MGNCHSGVLATQATPEKRDARISDLNNPELWKSIQINSGHQRIINNVRPLHKSIPEITNESPSPQERADMDGKRLQGNFRLSLKRIKEGKEL